jgi:hypothetical protein
MTSTPAQTPFIVRITKHLPIAEKIFLLALAIGIVLTYLALNSSVTEVSFIGLAITFFLYAYRPTDVPRADDERSGFSELLALLILPKVMWIGSAVSALGVAFYLINVGNDAYKQLSTIGGSTIAIAIVILAIVQTTGVKHLKYVAPILLRSVPLFLADLYMFFK